MNPPPLDATFSLRHPLRILLAEDDPISLKCAQLACRRLGYAVQSAHDGAEAWQLFQNHAPDFVLLDGHMPGLLGSEVARLIRSREASRPSEPASYLCMLTADDERHSPKWEEAGADRVLLKPLTVAALAQTILEARAKPAP